MSLYYVRRGGPWDYNGQPADRGLLLPVLGSRNDEKLVRLGFLEEVSKPRKLDQYPRCGQCGASFLEEGFLVAHGDMRHGVKPERIVVGAPHPLEGMQSYSATGVPGGVILPDLTGDSDERQLEREVPIYWEKTAASQKG